jgi:uncharacterized membrane protein YgcG|tara:strand:+ start:524 stop:781 length:258 start_codon:yes stop_codon:yes gene_type:complete
MSRAFGTTDTSKLKQIVSEGITVTREIEDLREGLKDTVDAIAKEMDLKPSVLNKAIRIAYKAELQKTKDSFEELEGILEAVGRTA